MSLSSSVTTKLFVFRLATSFETVCFCLSIRMISMLSSDGVEIVILPVKSNDADVFLKRSNVKRSLTTARVTSDSISDVV